MKKSSSIRRVLSCLSRREARRREAQKEPRRRRLFEALEAREMLDANPASYYETLPDTIEIAKPDTYHYAIEGVDISVVDSSQVEGLTASFPQGTQVAFTVMETTTDGAISTLGDVALQLFASEGEAPNSSNQFLDLVYNDYYEGLTIHRISAGFMFQGGSPNGSGAGGSGVAIADEHSDLLTHSRRGTVAFANNGPNTSDAQFYVTFDAASWLDGGYNVFGYVVDGYEVLEALENAEVGPRTLNGRIEYSLPVNSYTITNARVLQDPTDAPTADAPTADAASIQTQSVLRLTADENASGSTTLSYEYKKADGETGFAQTKVYVGQTGFEERVKEALDAVDFELIAGESVEFTLPTEFDGYAITYSVSTDDAAAHCEVVPTDAANGKYKLTTDAAGAQYLQLTVVASIASLQWEADANCDVFISPVAPTATFASSAAHNTEQGWFVTSDFVDPQMTLVVETYNLNESISFDRPFAIALGGLEPLYTATLTNYDPETGKATYNVVLELDASEALEEREYSLSIQRKIPNPQGSALLSEPEVLDFYVDLNALEFVDFPSSIQAIAGTDGSFQFKTNKTKNDGSQRGDLVYSIEGEKPEFLTISSSGLLSWSGATLADAGSRDVSIKVVDALGNSKTETVSFKVGGLPVFDDLDGLSVATGELFETTIVAKDSVDETVAMKYELVGTGYPSGLTLDSATGQVAWNVASDYLPTNASHQILSLRVKATEQLSVEGGGVSDGLSSEKTFEITVSNATHDAEQVETPVWTSIGAQTVEAGNAFATTAQATVSENAVGVNYSLVGTVGEDYPAGMTIDAATGAIAWDSPVDYFNTTLTRSTVFSGIKVRAQAVVARDAVSATYGGTSETSFDLTITNPHYVDAAPTFEPLTVSEVETGKSYSATIVAVDPNGEADAIEYELVGDVFPVGFNFDAATATVAWNVAEDYLAPSVASQAYRFTMRATELFENEDGSFDEGRSTEKTFEILVKNANYNEEEAAKPVWNEVAAQRVVAGEIFTLQVSATAPASVEGIEYFLDGDYPEGMTINSATGAIAWASSSDYFDAATPRAEKRTISLVAKTVVGSADSATNYGGSASTTFDLTIVNPKFVDAAPTFAELETRAASTGSTYEATIVANDPDAAADRIAYELLGEDAPEGFVFEPATGKLTWTIAENYLAENATLRVFRFTIRATEEYALENGEYESGLSTEKTFELLVANAAYDPEKLVAPTFETIGDQTAKTGKTFTVDVAATLPENADPAYAIEYSLSDEEGASYPEGMSIDSATGVLTWNVPEDYLTSDAANPTELTVKVQARTVLATSDRATDYSGSKDVSFKLTVEQSDDATKPSNWQEWFDAWVKAAQDRYDGNAKNLADYLTSYLTAVDKRNEGLKAANQQYSAGKIDRAELVVEREKIQSDFEDETRKAREDFNKADAATNQEFQKTTSELAANLEELKQGGADVPNDSERQIERATVETVAKKIGAATGKSNFRIVDPNSGAVVATNLKNVLKMWRAGYSRSSVYHDVYGDPGFAATAGEETTADPQTTVDADKTTTGGETNSTSGDASQNENQTTAESSTGDTTPASNDANANVVSGDPSNESTNDETASAEHSAALLAVVDDEWNLFEEF